MAEETNKQKVLGKYVGFPNSTYEISTEKGGVRMKKLFLSLFLTALIILPAHLVYAAVKDDTVVIYLSFDEGTGKDVKDQSNYGNHGEIVDNTDWTNGQFGKAVEIAGENTDCVVIPAADSLKIEGEITMMAWIKSAGWDGGDQWIDKNCHNGGEKNSYGIGVFGDNILMMCGDTGSRKNLSVNPLPEVDKWEHVAGTYDGSAMKVYLNGDLLGESAEKFDFAGTNDSPLRIGCSKDRANYTFNGAIDEVIIYSRALDKAEINNVMKSGISDVSPSGKLTTTWSTIKKQ